MQNPNVLNPKPPPAPDPEVCYHLQIVYILDQVRALEKEMRKRIEQQGLEIVPQILVVTRLIPDSKGTTCNQRLEKIHGTINAQILRVPFRQQNGDVLQQWISRLAPPPLHPSLSRAACMLKPVT